MEPTNVLYYPILVLFGIYIIAFANAIRLEIKQFKSLKDPDALTPFDYEPDEK